MRLNKLAATSASLLLAAGLLTACGGDEEPDGGSSSASSSQAEPAGDLTKDSFAATIASAMQESGTTHVSLSGSAAGQQITAEGDQEIGAKAADSKVSLTMEVMGQSLDLRLVDQVVYLNLGQASQDKFTMIDLTDTSNPLVAQFGSLATQADVSAQFESFEGAITDFAKGGKTESIDGVDTQPYTVTVDTEKLLASQGQEGTVAGLPASLDYTFYVGPDNLPRRLVSGVEGQEITLDFTKWGEDVSIEKPADDQISDLDLSQLGAGGA